MINIVNFFFFLLLRKQHYVFVFIQPNINTTDLMLVKIFNSWISIRQSHVISTLSRNNFIKNGKNDSQKEEKSN